jgi:hypothetical protein
MKVRTGIKSTLKDVRAFKLFSLLRQFKKIVTALYFVTHLSFLKK